MFELVIINLLALCFTGLFFCYILAYRNKKVMLLRTELNNRVYECQIGDIDKGVLDSKWRRDVFRSVSYNEMVFKFWKPLNSFYPDLSFIDPDATDPSLLSK